MKLLLRVLLVLVLFCRIDAAEACTGAGCVSAGPRLASMNSLNSTLLNALLGGLAGSSLSLTAGDWTSLANGSVSLASTVSALQSTLGVSSPTSALNTSATLAQILGAAATAATGQGQTSLALALNNLKAPLSLVSGTIRLGDLLQTDGALASTQINALELVTGVIQLYNAKNVATTPSAITISGASLGLTGLLNQITLAAQVVEPPVFVCGPAGSTFHTATVRVKLGIDLVSVALDTGPLKLIPLVNTVSAQIAHLDLYLELAHADGIITSVNAIANSFTVQATPGVASLYLGTIDPTVFFNRTHTLNAATDLTWGTIGTITVNTLTVSILAKASATGSPNGATPLTFTGPYPQSFQVSTGAIFVSNLLSSLASSLQISLTTGLGSLSGAVTLALGPIIQVALPVIVQPLVDSLINPLLELLGIGLGEVIVNAEGTVLECSISGSVYADANHSAKLEYGEAGTGGTLYAKLVLASAPTAPALMVATVDPTTGAYSFSGVTAAAYLVVVNGTSSASQVTPAAPSGWIGTEAPTQSLEVTMATADLASRNFGLYHGSVLSGSVFKDNGIGSGTANNGVRDGTEAAIVGAAVKITDSTGATVYDTTTSTNLGAYALWIPYTATGTLKVSHTAASEWVPVSASVGTTSGSYAQAASTVSFAFASGTTWTGVNFGDVPSNHLEPDGQQQVLPGTVAFFAHTYTAGTAGQVTFSTTASGATGWTSTLYVDANCNGRIDAGEGLATATMSTVADQKICLVVKMSSPATSAYNAQYAVALTAHFVYANNTLTVDQIRNDQANAGSASDSALVLLKAADKTTAVTGDVITYTVTYTNQSSATLTSVKILDSTPAYTVFSAASCGTSASGISACSVTAAPAGGSTGRIEWTLTGSITAGASGTVTLRVVVQ